MNKNEFYRELMKSYTIDTEKIKCNAKRKSPECRRVSNIHRWVTSFAACAAAAAIAVVSLSVFGGRGVDITEPNLDNAIERVYAAEARYSELSKRYSTMDMYVSFEEKLGLNEILIAFSAIDEDSRIKISLLYTADGKYYKNSGTLGDNLTFLGAKVTAPTELYNELGRLKCVSLVEVDDGKYTDKSFVPYSGNRNTDPPVTIDEPFQIVLPRNTTVAETVLPSETTLEQTESSETQPDETAPAVTEQETSPIEIPASGVRIARFIGERSLIVTTNDSIMLYKLDSGVLSLDTTFYAGGAKIAWVSGDETALFITACDGNGRNKLFYADGETETLTALDINSITSGAEIASVVCSDDGAVMIIKTVSTDRTYIYRAERSGNSITVALVKEYSNAASALTYANGTVYTAVSDAAGLTVTVYGINISDNQEREIVFVNGSVRFVRNNTLDAAILIFSDANGENEQYKLLTPEGELLNLGGSGEAVFSALDGKLFKLGERYYSAENGVITEISAAEAESFFAEKESPVSRYSVTVSEDGIAFISRIL